MAAVLTPGVYFESRPPALPAVLPRMDIAAFVGFAASGPVDIPVVIEDPGRFRDIFGDDPDLAWDPAQGRMAQGYLGAAVRAFFRSGGRRCWVVRVARPAAPAIFLVPGLLAWSAPLGFTGAQCTARSAGSWADRLRISAAATERAVRAADAAPSDLVRIRFAGSDLTGFRTPGGSALWFRPALPAESISVIQAIAWLGAGAPVDVATSAVEWADGALDIVLYAEMPGMAPGTWLRLSTTSGTLLACLDEVNGVRLRSSRVWWLVDAATAASATAGATPQTSVMELTLSAEIAGAERRQLAGLGMIAGHARYLGARPDDIDVFRDNVPAESPRFPLACHADRVFLPLGIVTPADDRFVQSALPSGLTRLERDGLASFGADLFLDQNLRSYGVSTLLDAAFHQQYQVDSPQPLRGLHALLPVEEISLVAMPDAVHRPWMVVPPGDARPEPPILAPVFVAASAHLEWSAVPGAASYELQASIDPAFATTLWQRTVTAPHDEDSVEDLVCGSDRWYRARALGDWGVTPWSNTEPAPRGRGAYEECGRQLPAAPLLADLVFDERTRLTWMDDGESQFQLQVSSEPDFAAAAVLYTGSQKQFDFWQQPGLTQYFRVRAAEGPWSNTVTARPAGDSAIVMSPAARDGEEPAAQLSTLEQLHAGLLIFCAARSDAFAVLSLPGHVRERTARQMRDQLVSSPRIANEERTLSFGALYHPWVVARDGELRTLPPDGAAAGIMASRTLAGGAWLAPANRIVAGAVALEPARLDPALRYGERFNIVEQTPGGFLVLNSDTLATDTDLRTIGTRRLTILIRRLAVREGNRLVFEPNDTRLARRIERQFEDVMGFLYARQAFAGATNEQAYRVIVRATADDTDHGRLFIELRFAPSEPMAFLTVRMVEVGGTWVVTESI
jgi:hypothetical protein